MEYFVVNTLFMLSTSINGMAVQDKHFTFNYEFKNVEFIACENEQSTISGLIMRQPSTSFRSLPRNVCTSLLQLVA